MKKLLTMLAASVLAVSSQADLLFWQVSSDTVNQYLGDNKEGAFAQIYVSTDGGDSKTALGTAYVFADGSGSSQPLTYDTVSAGGNSGISYLDALEGAYSSLGSTYAYPSNPEQQFVIELYNSSGEAVGNSGWMTGDMSQFISRTEFSSNFSEMTVSQGLGTGSTASWSAGAVPEPTSGLMLLVGMAMLGLRRRKVA